jgi:hypothetical protein
LSPLSSLSARPYVTICRSSLAPLGFVPVVIQPVGDRAQGLARSLVAFFPSKFFAVQFSTAIPNSKIDDRQMPLAIEIAATQTKPACAG